MPIITDEDMKKDIKSSKWYSQYFMYGAEYLIIEKHISSIVKKNVTVENSFNLVKFDEKTPLGVILETLESFPLMSDKKCVLIKNYNLIGLNDSDYKALLAALKDVNDTLIVIFYYLNNDLDFKASKVKKIMEQIDKNGCVVNYAKKDKAYLKKFVMDKCKANELTISTTNLLFFIERCSDSISIISNQLDKIIFYYQSETNKTITKELIIDLCPDSLDNTVFELVNSITNKKISVAYNFLDNILYQKIEPIAIIGALNNAVSDIYRAKLGFISGRDAKEIALDFSYAKNREFVVRNSLNMASKFDIGVFSKWFDILYKTDIKLKSSKMSSRVLLEQMIGMLFEVVN